MASALTATIHAQLAELVEAAGAYGCLPRSPPPDDAETLKLKVETEAARLTGELNTGLQTTFGTGSPYFDAEAPMDPAAAVQQVEEAVEGLKSANSSDKVERVLIDVAKALQDAKPAVLSKTLPAALLLKGIQVYVEDPLTRWMGAETLARTIATDMSGLEEQRTKLASAYDKALAEAQTRAERQSVKAQHFEDKEQFFTKALATLEGHIDSDQTLLHSLATHGTPEVEEASRALQGLLKDAAGMAHHIQAKAVPYAVDAATLDRSAASLTTRLGDNSRKLTATLTEALRLLKEHMQLQEELNKVEEGKKIRSQVERAVEGERQRLLRAVEAETARLRQFQGAVQAFHGTAKGLAQQVRTVCQDQQLQARGRKQAGARLFAKLYLEYYEQLEGLHSGKLKCQKALRLEVKRLQKQAKRWEELDYELPGMQQLMRLDERMQQLKEFQAQLDTELEALRTKLTALQSCGTDILATVPDFKHPSDTVALVRVEQLNQRREQLEGLLHKFGPMHFADKDLEGESSGTETCLDTSEPIRREVTESPYKIKRHLKRITDEIRSSPFASKVLPATPAKDLPCEDVAHVPVPTPDMLRKRPALGTRGTAFPSAKKRRKTHDEN